MRGGEEEEGAEVEEGREEAPLRGEERSRRLEMVMILMLDSASMATEGRGKREESRVLGGFGGRERLGDG